MRRPFFLAVLALVFISFLNSASPEDKTKETPVSEVSGAPEAVTAETEPAAVTDMPEVKPEEPKGQVILDDFLPEATITQGKWDWDTSQKYSGEKSHTEPSAKGITEHSYRMAQVEIPNDYLIEQYIYLDPNDPPKGIMMRFTYESEGGEGEIGIYRESEEEVFVFNNDEAVIYDGTLPEAGKWEKWTIDPDDLGMKRAKLTGISFITNGGKANWDLTQFVPYKKLKQSIQPQDAATN